jgi:hypothetical protein
VSDEDRTIGEMLLNVGAPDDSPEMAAMKFHLAGMIDIMMRISVDQDKTERQRDNANAAFGFLARASGFVIGALSK